MDASHPETKLRYRPLVSKTAIRLVMIHPGSRDDLIRCHLMYTKLGAMDYEA